MSGNLEWEKVKEWYNAQAEKLKEYAKNSGELYLDDIEVRFIENYQREKLGDGNIVGFNDKVLVKTNKGKAFEVDFSDIDGCTVLGKRKINFYLNGSTTLQVKGTERFNAIKYLQLYQIYKERKTDD